LETVQPESGVRAGTRFAWVLLYTLFVVYTGFFVFCSSFVIDGERYFCLFDDAMVSMRYARNLAEGHGLVWNPGEEKVEGFTTPFWTVYMGVPHLLGLSPSKTSLFIQISALVCLLLNLLVIAGLARLVGHCDSRIAFASVLLVAFFYPLNNWALMGMEVGLLALMISTATLLALKVLQTGTARFSLYVLLGISTLIRLDAAVIAVVIVLFLAIAQPRLRRLHLVAGLGSIVAVFLVQTLFRWTYYGDLLPNTYYLKMVGYPGYERIHWGFNILLLRLSQLNWVLCIFPFAYVLLKRHRELLLPASMIVAQAAYSVYVGGDAWEAMGTNRYLLAVAPIFFVVFSVAGAQALEWAAAWIKKPSAGRWAFAALIALSLVRFNLNGGLESLSVVFLQAGSPLAVRNPEMVSLGLLLRQVTKDDASIAVVWAGIIPYFSGRPSVDLLGKSDRTIAHQEMHRNKAMGFWPGHLKWDYRFSIETLKPDVIVQIWADQAGARRFLADRYVTAGAFGRFFCARRSSPEIEWSKLATAECQGTHLLCPPPL